MTAGIAERRPRHVWRSTIWYALMRPTRRPV